MKKASEHMTEDYSEYDDGDATLSFMKASVKFVCCCLDDQWDWRWLARAISIATSRGDVKRLPWETLIFSSGPIDGYPTQVTVPKKFLLKEANVREVVCQHFEDYGWCSIEKMKAEVRKHSTEWNKLFPTWWMSEKFLNDHVDEMLENHLKVCLLNCLPKPMEYRCMSKTLTACRTSTNGPVVMAARKSTERELSAATNLLQDMVEARSPTCGDLENMSEFAVTFIKRCENFCCLNPGWQSNDCLGVKKRTFGKEALQHRFKWCLEDETSAANPNHLKVSELSNGFLMQHKQAKFLNGKPKLCWKRGLG